MPREIKRIIVHCSASTWGCRSVIDEWHKERGWDGIGYHYVIVNGHPYTSREFLPKWDGRVEAGRDLDVVGAHVAGHNEDSVGICLIGSGDGRYTPRQINELQGLIEYLRGRHNIPAGQVMGHRDLNPHKECPGFDVQQWITGQVAS